MAPSPTIPTSFVPKQPVKTTARFTRTGGNTFLMFSVFALGLALVGAGGAFGYKEYLKGIEKERVTALKAAQNGVNTDEVDQYIRSRDRFGTALGVLDKHVALSNFFDLLEEITLVNVRFDSFSYTLLEDGSAEISLSGSARSFNALAAQSSVFSSEKNLREAIFSGIELDEDGTVGFSVDATVTSDILAFTVDSAQAEDATSIEVSGETVPVEETAPVETSLPPVQEDTVTPPQL